MSFVFLFLSLKYAAQSQHYYCSVWIAFSDCLLPEPISKQSFWSAIDTQLNMHIWAEGIRAFIGPDTGTAFDIWGCPKPTAITHNTIIVLIITYNYKLKQIEPILYILTLLFTDQCLLQQMRPWVTIVMIPQLKVIMMRQYFEEKTQRFRSRTECITIKNICERDCFHTEQFDWSV